MNDSRWVLELLGSDGRTVELPAAGTLVLGSARERVGFAIEGQGVDETHCVIGRTKEGDWAVKDLGSRNGTLVNGQRVAASRLKLGDQLVLGSRRLEVRPFKVEAARAAVAAVGSARPNEAPQKIAGYRVERLIGKGGMGAVYLAVQESLRRPVALKVLAPKLAADLDFVHRFQAEARAAAALSHPNVVVVYDVGEENGAHYLSMEFMAGGSLEQKLAAAGPLAWKAVLGVLHDAAAGLAYAESRGIVHRDIKPANLMYSGTGTVKIADLGLATTLEQEAIEADALPGGGRKVYGTPHFIAPEQARGEAVDNRSDLYSLGATAYRLLSGKTPFEGGSTREILRALQNDAPRPLRELVSDLPADLEGVIQRLMQKEPAARFPTAEALRRECERLRLVAEHGPTLEVERGARSQRTLALLLLVVILGASAVWYTVQHAPSGPPPSAAPDVSAFDPLPVPDDSSFISGKSTPNATTADEEAALRAREHEADVALRGIAPFLEGEERIAALERVRGEYPGTAAAASAASEIAGLRVQPTGSTPAASLEQADQELATELEQLVQNGAALAARLAACESFQIAPELATEFAARRAAREHAEIQRSEEELRRAFVQSEQIALEGKFAELRTFLAGLEPRFAELDGLPGDPARFAGLREQREDLARRRARVDEQERFWFANAERQKCRAVGEALGPGSGCLAELATLDLDAIEQRVARLPAELQARPLPSALVSEARLARTALDNLRREFSGGGWRRKQLLDPRSKKLREVRDLKPEGLVFDKDGALETVTWREAKSDPEWWHLLFQARLGRDWTAEEARAIAALLRMVGASRGAELAREMIAPGARGTLQPAELQLLAGVFAPALSWVGASDARRAFEHENACAQALARALTAAQGRSWTNAAVELERALGEGGDSVLIGLLSDGSDWRYEAAKPAPQAAPAAPSPGPEKK